MYSLYRTEPKARMIAIIPATLSADHAESIQSMGFDTLIVKVSSHYLMVHGCEKETQE